MAEGGHGSGPELAWWQALLGGLGTLLMGWGIGLRRGRTSGGVMDLSPELVADIKTEHSQTRSDIRLILDQMREERVAMIELVREEGREQRKALYALGDKLVAGIAEVGRGVSAIDKDVTRLLDRVPRRDGG